MEQMRSKSSQMMLGAIKARGMQVRVVSRRFNLLEVKRGDVSWLIKGTSFPVNSQPACLVANNKFLTKKLLRFHGILTPKSWLVKSPQEALRLMGKYDLFPCVLKPARGAHGKRVYANIESEAEFRDMLKQVFHGKSEGEILVEEYVAGKDYRVLVVGKGVSAVMERTAAFVVGNGHDTIRALITAFNASPLVGKKYEKPMCRIQMNGEVRRNLSKQGKKFGDTPLAGERVALRQNANISTGGIGRDVTFSVDPVVKQVAVAAAQAIGMAITGVDIIFSEVNQKAYVLELNDCPGIDIHHFPALGQSRDVAGDIVDYLITNLVKVRHHN